MEVGLEQLGKGVSDERQRTGYIPDDAVRYWRNSYSGTGLRKADACA